MKNLLLKLFAFTLLAGFFCACNETLVEEQPVDDLELKSAQNGLETYIVVLNDAELDAELSNLEGYEKRKAAAFKAASNLLNRAGIVDGQINHAYGTAIKGFSVKIPPGQLKKLENDPSVKFIEKNQVFTLSVPQDIEIYEAEAQYADTRPWGIKRVRGGVSAYDGADTAWIIDSGIDLDHPDLNVDESRGFTAFTSGTDRTPDDRNGHGTHVAGIVAAKINNTGVVGVAPGAPVIPVKVLNRNNYGTIEHFIAGVDYVAAKGKTGHVAVMALGASVSEALDLAVYNASENEIKFILSAGNNSEHANNRSPARVNGTYIYTISAMDSTDNYASFSNYGNPPIDFCQPGVSIYSTHIGGQYATRSGTSMAAAHMAGILLWGAPGTDGTVNGDPDGNADAIAVVGGAAPVTYTISAMPGEGGSIDPSGNIVVNEGANQTFTIAPDAGYRIDDVLVDNSSVGAVSSYTFENVIDDHTIHATFSPMPTYTIMATAGEGGSIDPSGDVVVNEGDDQTFSIAPNVGYEISDVTINDISVGVVEIYTFENVTANHSIHAYFEAIPTYMVSGMVTDMEGAPLAYATITIENTSQSATTGNDGSYSVAYVEAGDYIITASLNGYESNSKSISVVDSDLIVEFTLKEISGGEAPTIGDVVLTDTSNPVWKRVSVDWTVNDNDGDLLSVKSELYDPDEIFVESATSSVSGSTASGIHELGKNRGISGTYTVVITVTDNAGNSNTGTYYKELK
jgi:hypothetical protein